MRLSFGASIVLLPFLAGCGNDPSSITGGVPKGSLTALAAGGVAGEQGFYPLEIGNKWHYDHTLTFQNFPDGGPPEEPQVFQSAKEAEITGEEELAGRTYRVQESRFIDSDSPNDPYVQYDYYRQAKDGLFWFDPTGGGDSLLPGAGEYSSLSRLVASASPEVKQALESIQTKLDAFHLAMAATSRSISSPSGASGAEYPFLVYPLHPNLEWIMRPTGDPFLITREVVGVDVLNLPAGHFTAYKIKHDLPEVFGPNDVAYFWYGRDGAIGYTLHVEGEYTDASGQRAGVFVGEEREILDGIDLVKPGK